MGEQTERKEFEVDRRRATTCLNVMTKVEAGGTIPSRFEELCRVGDRDAAARRCRAGTSSAACGLVALTAAMHKNGRMLCSSRPNWAHR